MKKISPVLLALFLCSPLIFSLPPAQPPMIFGMRYSAKLGELIQQAEKGLGRPLRFVEKKPEGENYGELRTTAYFIHIPRGDAEDDIAHEVMHAILISEGFMTPFHVNNEPDSPPLAHLFKGDLAHIIINQRLEKEGYDPLNGFMKGWQDRYLSIDKDSHPGTTPNERAFYEATLIHDMLHHVCYVRAPFAELAILKSHPELEDGWKELKKAIAPFEKNPSPMTEVGVVKTLNSVLDTMFKKAGSNLRFSSLVGFQPYPFSKTELAQPAAKNLKLVREGDGDTKMFHNGVMVGLWGRAISDSELSLPLAQFVTKYKIAGLPVMN